MCFLDCQKVRLKITVYLCDFKQNLHQSIHLLLLIIKHFFYIFAHNIHIWNGSSFDKTAITVSSALFDINKHLIRETKETFHINYACRWHAALD